MSIAPSNKKTLFIVFFTVFLDLIGFGIIIPIQPFFAQKLGANPAIITLLGASFSLMQFLFAAVWGRLSDRVGRRPVILVSIAITALGYLWFGFADSLAALFAARMLAGFGSANIGTAQAIIADSTSHKTRAKGMGIIGAAFGLGFIFGPALGAFFSQYGLTVPAFVASALSFMNWIFAFTMLPETYPKEVRAKKSHVRGHGFSYAALKHAARHPNVTSLFTIYVIYTIAFSMMEQSIGLFLEHMFVDIEALVPEVRAKQAAALTGYYLIAVGITATIVQGGLIGKLAKRFGEQKLLATGMFFIAVSLAATPFFGTFQVFRAMFIVACSTALGAGLTNPSLNSLLSRSVNPDEQGGTLGLGQSLSALGRVIGPAFAGVLFERSIGLPFWLGGILMLACVTIALSLKPQALTES
jgi:MFS transporter, DHA1 family, tetracycline resistance protein